jgi:hypothetical protein
MGTPRLDDDRAQEAADLYREHGNIVRAAKAANVARSTFRNRLRHAVARGMLGTKPVLPTFAITKVASQLGPNGELQREWIQQQPEREGEFHVPDGHAIKGVSAYLDAQGNVIGQWIKTREALDPLATVEAIKAAFDGYEQGAAAAPAPEAPSADLLTLLPLSDWHVGLHTWAGEVESNWDLKIAEATIARGIDDVVERSPSSGQSIVLGGGDLLHADNNRNETARSGHVLQVDGRYQKVLMTACRLVVRTVDASLRRHEHVTVRILPGNHDEHSSVAVAYFLLAWYRNEPRVTVDVDASLFFWFRFGKVLIGATHGHTVKIRDMPQIMAHRRAEDWGATRFRYVHGFHLHHTAKTVTEGGGVVTEVHQTPSPQDAWSFGKGFLSGRSLQTITYHRSFGEVSRSRVAILDGVAA